MMVLFAPQLNKNIVAKRETMTVHHVPIFVQSEVLFGI